MAGDKLKCRQSKGNNSSITDYTLMKLHVHNHTMVIYIQYKFHEIPYIAMTDATLIKLDMQNLTIAIYIQYKFHEILSIRYVVMAEDVKIIEI